MLLGSLNSKASSIVLVALVCLILLVGCSNGAQDDSRFSDETVERLDNAIANQMEYNDLPGVVVGVWVPGEGEYVVARGKANLRTGEQRDLDDPFRIGSITKTFTATAVLQLVDQGKLSKTDTLSKWYPDFPNADQITVEDLLRMQSGIADSFDEEWWEDYEENSLGDISAEDMIERSASRGDRFAPPGQKTEYTNVNYVILGEIVEKVSGKDIGARITQTILEPLGMEDTIYPTNNDLPGDLRGYHRDIDRVELKDTTNLNPTPGGAAGAMISNIWDLKTWAEAVCTGELLEPETHRERLQTRPLVDRPDYLEYGEGIMKMGDVCGHGGDVFGFSSRMWYLPERDATIVVNVNRTDPPNTEPAAGALAKDITRILFPKYVDNRW